MPPEDHRHLQHGWDELLYEHHFSALLNSVSDAKTKARLLLVASSERLGIVSVPSLGTKVDNESLRMALGLRLGVPIVVEHTRICGAVVDVYGSHGLSCRWPYSTARCCQWNCPSCSGVWGFTCCFGACGCMS